MRRPTSFARQGTDGTRSTLRLPMYDLSEDDRDAILRLHHRWLQLERDGREADVLDLCAPDVTWMVPGRAPLEGRDAVRRLLAGGTARIQDLSAHDVRVRGHGRLAYKTCRYRTRYQMGADGPVETAAGHHLWIVGKDMDARWRVQLVTWQSL